MAPEPTLPPQPPVHIPVLRGPAMKWLDVRQGGTYLDCTAGLGGHSALIAQALAGTGRLIALDRDPSSVMLARECLSPYENVTVIHRNYGELQDVLTELEVPGVDGILIDAGLSSMQLDSPERGFSFQEEGELDMRMNRSQGMTAQEYLATVDERELARVLRAHGDVGPARRIAAAIVKRSRESRMHTTRDLAEAVSEALPFAKRTPDETRTCFQAIRIVVNEEIRWLESGLRQAVDALNPRGRLVVIAFHGGEEVVVKNVLRQASRTQRDRYPDGRTRSVTPPRVKLLTRKPVQADEEECRANPRARSAKLRAAERLEEGGTSA
ncbi:MAG: 16S rRNA (cytosine(1402)-N(4))-methyltransferase RsmH [Nitrospiraceae bacterium]|nr:16S rRNA (cytosine(1402)-N(4))-methyltransferase RsmH [Nitrospiraceae bacterium]